MRWQEASERVNDLLCLSFNFRLTFVFSVKEIKRYNPPTLKSVNSWMYSLADTLLHILTEKTNLDMELVILHVNSNRKHRKKWQKGCNWRRNEDLRILKQSWLTYQQHRLTVTMRRESLESRFYKKNNDTNDQNKTTMTIKTIFPGVDSIYRMIK